MPASAVNCVEPSATTTACQSVPATTEPPKETAVPLIVIELLANLAFAIEPDKCTLSTEPSTRCSESTASSASLAL